MVPNHFPWWKNLLIVAIVLLAFLYALPNLYVEDPSVQISPASAMVTLDQPTLETVTQALQKAGIPWLRLRYHLAYLWARSHTNSVPGAFSTSRFP